MLCKGFEENRLKNGHGMHSGYLEGKMGFRIKKALSLDRFENACRSA